ncbi:unnamed protein product [Brassica oleracea]
MSNTFVRGKPELMTKLRRKVASARIKKDIKAAKARAAEAEKNGSVGDQPPPIKMSLRDARIRFNQIMRPLKKAKAKTPLENTFLHLRI